MEKPARLLRAAGWAFALAAGLIGGALGACRADTRAQRRKAGEVIISIGAAPKTLDPGLSQDINSTRAIMNFIRGLTVLDARGFPQPDIAESWSVSPDGRLYDFRLRVTSWSNGEPVTAEDFVHAWLDRQLNPDFGSEYSYMLFYIEGAQAYYERRGPREAVGVEAVHPLHLRVRLVAPAPFFPQLTAHHTYFPVSSAADRAHPGWALRPETYVGNGPFRLTAYHPNDFLEGVRREDYWDSANVAMRRLRFLFIEEETTERIAFDNGEIDGTYLAPRADIPQLRGSPALRIAEQIGTYYININMKLPVFADRRVRQALNLAIDRQAIVANVTRADERPAYGIVPPLLYGELPPRRFVEDGRFEEARRLMAEAGYPGGRGFPRLRYLYNTLEMHRAIAQVLQESWKRELGIEITPENQEFRVVIENRNQGRFDLARNGWVADFADPINFLDLFLSTSGNNNTQWSDPEFDRLVEASRREADPARRLEILRRAEAYFMDQLVIIPIFHYTHPYLSAPDLEGYDLSPMGTIDVRRLRWK